MQTNYFDFSILNTQLAALLKAGVNLTDSLRSISQDVQDKSFKKTLLEMAEDIEKGHTFHEAVAKQSWFPGYFAPMVAAGEKSGQMAQVLSDLGFHARFLERIKKHFSAALIYPLIVLLLGIFAALFYLIFVLPIFQEMFSAISMSLPWLTNVVIFIANYLAYPLLILMVLATIVGVSLFYSLHRYHPKAQLMAEKFILKIPLIRTLYLNLAIVNFTKILWLLLKSSIPLPNAVKLAGQATDNQLLATESKQLAQALEKGVPFTDALKQSQLPETLVWLMTTEKSSANLEDSLSEASQLYELEAETNYAYMSALIGPVLILSVGSVIGLFIIACYWPMFSTITTFQ